MKNALPILTVLVTLLLSAFPLAQAEAIDLSSMTFNELVALKEQLNLAIWNSKEWQEVTVPQGVWQVGKDIPAGHWTIRTKAVNSRILVCTALDATGKNVDYDNTEFYYAVIVNNPSSQYFDATSHNAEIDYDLKEGSYVIITLGSAIFSPYAGKPSLGFK